VVQGSAPLDLALLALPPLALGLLVTAHVAIVSRLLGRTPRWRGLLALVVPPLAVVWGMKIEMRGWCRVWIAAAIVYLGTLALAVGS
jgi:hypothetical protein